MKQSNEQSSPSCANGSAPGMSYGVAPVSSATEKTCSVGTYRNSAFDSIKRRINQGQAIRSIFGRSRVTHLLMLFLQIRTLLSEVQLAAHGVPGGESADEEAGIRLNGNGWTT